MATGKPPNGTLALRPPIDLTPAEADLSSAAIDAFAVAVGGRQQLLETLEIADSTPEVHRVVERLLDPVFGGWNLRKLCGSCGITVADLFSAYKKALIVRAHLLAFKVCTDHLVDVVTDVMTRSKPYEATCESCDGVGSTTPEPSKAVPNPSPIPCPFCRSTGRRIVLPDLDRQKLALELGQLITKSSGISLFQQQNVVASGSGVEFGPSALAALQQAATDVLTPRRPAPGPVIEAEVTAPPAEEGA